MNDVNIPKRAAIMTLLREQTRAYHDQLENQDGLLQRMNAISGYRQVLQRFYGIIAPLERGLAEVFRQCPPSFDSHKRRRSAMLKADLWALGDSKESLLDLPLPSCLPALSTLPQAYGCLYVLEGSTLGGQLIARHLEKTLGLDAGNGAAFFNSYGADIGRMWREFGDALTAYVALSGNEDQIITAACETFAAFADWLVQNQQWNDLSPPRS